MDCVLYHLILNLMYKWSWIIHFVLLRLCIVRWQGHNRLKSKIFELFQGFIFIVVPWSFIKFSHFVVTRWLVVRCFFFTYILEQRENLNYSKLLHVWTWLLKIGTWFFNKRNGGILFSRDDTWHLSKQDFIFVCAAWYSRQPYCFLQEQLIFWQN